MRKNTTNNKTLIVNLLGGPGAGKSTNSARIFSALKDLDYNVELVTEYAKDLTWGESYNVLRDQIYVFGKQQHRIWRLDGKVEIIITDSPLLLSTVYGETETSKEFKDLVISEYFRRPTVNIMLNRVKKYNPKGRNQTLDESIDLDAKIKQRVEEVDKIHLTVDGAETSKETIVNFILEEYSKLVS
jgi:adenylate kinase family enzyme